NHEHKLTLRSSKGVGRRSRLLNAMEGDGDEFVGDDAGCWECIHDAVVSHFLRDGGRWGAGVGGLSIADWADVARSGNGVEVCGSGACGDHAYPCGSYRGPGGVPVRAAVCGELRGAAAFVYVGGEHRAVVGSAVGLVVWRHVRRDEGGDWAGGFVRGARDRAGGANDDRRDGV